MLSSFFFFLFRWFRFYFNRKILCSTKFFLIKRKKGGVKKINLNLFSFFFFLLFHLRRVWYYQCNKHLSSVGQLFYIWRKRRRNKRKTRFLDLVLFIVCLQIRETQGNKKKKKKSSRGSGRTMAGRSGEVRSILLVVYLFLLSSGKSLIFIFIFFNPFRLFHHPIFLFMAIEHVERPTGIMFKDWIRSWVVFMT